MEAEPENVGYVYGDVCDRKREQRRKRQKLLVTQLIVDYAKNSTLHGLRYIADKGLSIVERLFWLLTVIVSIALCSFYIYNLVEKWKTSPVIVTVNGRLSSVGSVPFPSVTICPQLKVNKKAYNYTEKFQMYLDNESLQYGDEFTKFLHVDLMCENEDFAEFNPAGYLDSSAVKDITEAAPSLDDVIVMCNWYDRPLDFCSTSFSKVITADGVCYTTNSLAASDIFENTIQSNYSYMDGKTEQKGWSLDGGYNNSYKEFFPKRGRVLGSDPDLIVVLLNDPDKGDRKCNKISTGYKVYLNHPADFPQTSMYYYAALPNEQSSVAVSFHEFNSDSDLQKYDTEIRQCYFPSDRKLRYFKIYTAVNCQAECLSNYTYKMCKCVGFYMPHDNSSEICNPVLHNNCMIKAKDTIALAERSSDLGLDDGGCRCLPSCNTIEYDAEVLKADYRMGETWKDFTKTSGYSPLTTYSRIDFFYKKSQFVTMQRRELYGFTDLLANIGGLLGLFLGFSFLSLVEIIYFLTVRLGFTLKRDLKKEKAQEAKEAMEQSQLNDLNRLENITIIN